MLQRSIRHSIRGLRLSSALETCAVCQCDCGRILRRPEPTTWRKYARAAPAVWERQRKKYNATQLTPAEARAREEEKEQLREKDKIIFLAVLQHLKRESRLDSDVSDANDFWIEFTDVMREGRSLNRKGQGVNAQTFKSLLEKYEVSERDCTTISVATLNFKSEYRSIAKSLMFSASHAGSESATIRIMNHAVIQARGKPNVLRSEELSEVRKHLRAISDEGENYRAMVLDGKVAYALGNHDLAIKSWERAMSAAVAASEEAQELRATGKAPLQDSMAGADLSDLSSPWVELQGIYIDRSRQVSSASERYVYMDNARRVVRIGCSQDDPISHYTAALFERVDETRVRSGWVYYMTKAAASGYVKAMHDLGRWYVEASWPYVADEPPDEIKPTPFDRYPHDPGVTKSASISLMQKTRIALGLAQRALNDPKHDVFHTAMYPITPLQRFQMGLEWLEIAMSFTYLPSFLLAAQLHLIPKLYDDSAKSKTALELSDDRYEFASKADYEANRRIERPSADKKSSGLEIPNPNYDAEKAKSLVREIFHADGALAFRRWSLNLRSNKIRSGDVRENQVADQDEMGMENNVPQHLAPNIRKWFRYPDIREQYMDDWNGLLRVDEGEDLLKDAKDMCDEQGWDMYADDGGLLYRHGMQRKAAGSAAKMAAVSR